MDPCRSIEPILAGYADGEATPDDALRVARHLPDCTACRIRLARERRLAEWLEQDLVDLPVSEDFVDAVMRRLPAEPPARRRRRLELATLGGLALACVGAALAGLGGDVAAPVAAGGFVPPLEAGPAAAPLLAEALRAAGGGALAWSVSFALLAAAVAAATALLGAAPARLRA